MSYVAATDWPVSICHIEPHRDGTPMQKLWHVLRAFARALVLSLSSRRFDVLHVHIGDFPSLYRKMLVAWPLFAFARCPSVLHMHGAAFLAEYARQPAFGRWLARRFIARFDLVIALSDQWRADLVARFTIARIIALPNAVPVPAEPPPRDLAAPRAFLFLGLIGARKGVIDLVQAAHGLAAQDASFTLAIGGNGDSTRLCAVIKAYDLAQRVTYLGWIDSAARDRIIRTSHVLVLPSYAEGAPMAIIEAMAAGMPIIATRVGAIPELVEHGHNGLLIEPGDVDALTAAMATLARDPDLCAQMGARSHAIAHERLSLPAHKTALIAAYRSLLAGAGHGD